MVLSSASEQAERPSDDPTNSHPIRPDQGQTRSFSNVTDGSNCETQEEMAGGSNEPEDAAREQAA
jgi:hypothetical protein